MTTDLAQHTDTGESDHEKAKRRIAEALVNEARGRDNAISSSDLADRTPVSASTVRDLIRDVRREYRLPIGNANGYFVIEASEEFARQVEKQKQRAETSRETARDIAKAWNQDKAGD